MSFKNLSLDFTPLKTLPNYRWLYLGQLVSFFGSMITYVAIPYQMYEMTGSTFQVGLLGIVQLIPLVLSGFWGGAIADSFDRRRVVVITEGLLIGGNIALIVFTLSGSKNYYFLYALAALMAVMKGFERPSLEALTQQLISKKDIPKISSLQSLKTTSGQILGPALGGVLIASFGIGMTYAIDLLTYAFSIMCLVQLKNVPALLEKRKANVSSMVEGFRYALTRHYLLGTYVVDMLSMSFAFPNPLFPALAKSMGGASKLGWLYSATAIGAFLASITSGWTQTVLKHGQAISWAACIWCLGILGFGLSSNFYIGLFCLAIAGFADMISGIFRATVWNETIPESYRGRLASVEMISYSSGPLIGNTFMGLLASKIGHAPALEWGGGIGAVLSLSFGFLLTGFWTYKADRT